ncbi:GpW/Gp25/anti-adapter protein IraD [uncultured Caudovirales phage]|uniref:GpW/Gp25/anti-adapter protein IraD n=1 Tax=uncultured Caudovirales phage TaxID=2100421 RepID=A0A6J5KJ56_9CAUD|nr:GpW/Gp25/anti-adapter protein IraD [uncultured Caudovirales phage]
MSVAIKFPFTLDTFGKVATTEYANQIYLDRVLTLLSTNIGQRPMLPEYGIDWNTALFENDDNVERAATQAITSAISKWIPEVEVMSIIFKNDYNGKEEIMLGLKLPDSTVASLPISSSTFSINGTVK